jgi:uncharacterized protein (DUF924 family)
MDKIDAILNFWFEGITSPDQFFGPVSPLWFSSTPEFNEKIRQNFLSDIDRAIAGEYDSWLATGRGCLAMIILTDQFTRNLFPDSREQLKGDPKAISVVEHLIREGLESQLWPVHLFFAYLPFEHSEEMRYQDLSIQKYTQLIENTPEHLRDNLSLPMRFAVLHRNVIVKFGRYPGRNKLLGRVSTEEEEKYLAEDEFAF